MKKIFLLVSGMLMTCAVYAQVLEEGESALMYYSPKTGLVLDFTYTVEHYERGQFADYAEALLGITDAVKETSNVYTLDDVHIGATTATDYSRPHKVNTESGLPLLLHINDKGLLTGYNTEAEPDKPAPKKKPELCQSKKISQDATPYPESVLKAATPQAQAFETAKQIFHLRETRMYLLNGEVEHAPADGQAMELVLKELDRQERALTALFTGSKRTGTEKKTVYIEPSGESRLFFFSEENGFTDGDNVDADTIEIRMICQQQTRQALDENTKKKKKVTEMSPIVYNVPGSCSVDVLYKGQRIAGRAIPVAQLGVDVALPKALFTGKELPKIIFSEKTGNIISISK